MLQPYAAGSLSSIASSSFSGTAFDAKGNAIAGTGFKSLSSVSGDAGMIAFSAVVGGASAKLTGGNFWQGAVTGLVVSGLNHAMHKIGDDSMFDDDDQQQKGKSMEEMLQKKLYSMKIGSSMKGSELDFLDKNASYGIKSITRVSQTKFSIKPTPIGSWKGIEDNAYLTIEPNKAITGKYFDKDVKTITGYKVTQYNTPPMQIGNSKTNTYIINGNNAYYQKTPNTISSWDLRN
jgi:hypothetical protein